MKTALIPYPPNSESITLKDSTVKEKDENAFAFG